MLMGPGLQLIAMPRPDPPFNVATLVIHVIIWIATHLLTPEGWKAELA